MEARRATADDDVGGKSTQRAMLRHGVSVDIRTAATCFGNVRLGGRGRIEAYRTLVVAKGDMQTQNACKAAPEHLFSVSTFGRYRD